MPTGSEIAASVMHDVASRLTPDLRHHAVQSGWPESAAAKLSVIVSEDGAFTHQFSGSEREFQSLEFGTVSKPPLPAINNFFGNHLRDMDFRARIAEEMSTRATEMILKAFS